ncbi:MAG TPA: hypothetical protein VES67_05900 [Vicinamibacterales bacterium]|nr:hypothetical protein [Vicinamibacterales bacterium]
MATLRSVVNVAAWLVPVLLFGQGCAPLFSDARLVGPGQTELTASLTPTGASVMGENRRLMTDYRLQAMRGVTNRLDLGVGYARLQPPDGGTGAHALGFGPKLALVTDRVAVAARVAFLFGDEVPVKQSWHVDPTVLLTFPLTDRIDLNPSVRFLIPFCEDCETLFGFNVGLGISPGSRRMKMRPEVGLLFSPREKGVVWTMGFGLSFRTAPR